MYFRSLYVDNNNNYTTPPPTTTAAVISLLLFLDLQLLPQLLFCKQLQLLIQILLLLMAGYYFSIHMRGNRKYLCTYSLRTSQGTD